MPADGAGGAHGVMFAPAIAEPEVDPNAEDPQPNMDLDNEDDLFTLPTKPAKMSACVRNLGSLAKSNVPRTVY